MQRLNSSFGKVVRERRKQLGISQEALSFRSGVHRTFISEIERGLKSPTLHTVFALAEALQIEASELIRLTEQAEHRTS